MSRPQKHPRTGVYWCRKAVPQALREVVGKREITRSLRTKDPAEARKLFPEVARQIDAKLENARLHVALLSQPEQMTLDAATIARLSEAYFVHLLTEDEEVRLDGFSDEPRQTRVITPEDIEAGLPLAPSLPDFDARAADIEALDAHTRHLYARGQSDSFFDDEVDEVLSWDGFHIRLSPASPDRKKAVRALQEAFVRATKIIRERNSGEPVVTPQEPVALPQPSKGLTPRAAADKVASTPFQSLSQLLEDWWKEAKTVGRSPSTYEGYRNTVNCLRKFLGHDDAAAVQPSDIVRFKDHRLQNVSPRTGKPVSARTVKDGDLAALKTVFSWGVANLRLPSNPAAGITIKLGKQVRTRDKGFTDAEAVALLKAADNHQPGSEDAKTYQAKCWIPWLSAYTGARVGELAQLRKQDIRQEGQHWVLRITPEAGTVKTGEARDVVLHEHLIEKGFPTFAGSSASGPLFLTPSHSGDIRGPWRGLKNRLAEFARETVTDPRVQPNHGWRHRFKTAARSVGMDSRVVDAIQGHAARTAGDDYGDVTIAAMALAMAKFPRQA